MGNDNGQPENGVAGIVAISDLNEERRDLGILRRAASEDWGVPRPDRPAIVRRMVGIVKRTSVTVATMTGPCEDESTADAHAIAAARVLVAMVGHDQADRHHVEDLNAPKAPTQHLHTGPTIIIEGGEWTARKKSASSSMAALPSSSPVLHPPP